MSEIENHTPQDIRLINETMKELFDKTGFAITDLSWISKTLDDRDELLECLLNQAELYEEWAEDYAERARLIRRRCKEMSET